MRMLPLIGLLVSFAPMGSSAVVPLHRVPTSGAWQPDPPPCIPSDAASQTDRCSNLLPAWFDDIDDDGPATQQLLRDLFETLSRMPLQQDSDSQLRRVRAQCRNSPNPDAKAFRVKYEAPDAMRRFPATGTAGRALVSAIFTPDPDSNCAEAKYRLRDRIRQLPDGKRMIQFIAVRTGPATTADGQDLVFGSWSAWAITRKASGRLRLVALPKSGTYVRCGTPHPHEDLVAYADCATIEGLQAMVQANSVTGIKSLGDAIREFKARNSQVTTALQNPSRVTSDATWARCGSLGCCAAM